ncbi:hypothetical protein IOD13_12535 [Brevibacterium casei]|nr:hypothetical protein [Brevibacterium casei]
MSRRLRAEVPEVEEIRLWGADIGFFSGFTLFSSVPYVLGGRGHAQMIPFGVGSIPLSLDLHAKLGYFAHDIGHPEFVVPVGPEGMVAGGPEERAAEAGWLGADVARGTGACGADTSDGGVGRRARGLADRIVAAVMDAYSYGVDLQEDLAATRERFWEVTRDNHRAIGDALGSPVGRGERSGPGAQTTCAQRSSTSRRSPNRRRQASHRRGRWPGCAERRVPTAQRSSGSLPNATWHRRRSRPRSRPSTRRRRRRGTRP